MGFHGSTATPKRTRRDRINRLRERLKTCTSAAELRGILEGILDLLADEL